MTCQEFLIWQAYFETEPWPQDALLDQLRAISAWFASAMVKKPVAMSVFKLKYERPKGIEEMKAAAAQKAGAFISAEAGD